MFEKKQNITEPHISLRPSINVILVVFWMSLAVFFGSESIPLPIVISGALFGIAEGIMWILGIKESGRDLQNVQTILDVREQLKKTKWGKRYFCSIWTGSIALFFISLSYSQPFNTLLVGYFIMCFFREITALKSSFELLKIIRD